MFVSTLAKIKIFGVAYNMFHNIPGVSKIPTSRRFEQVAACFIMYLASPKYLPADVLSRLQHVRTILPNQPKVGEASHRLFFDLIKAEKYPTLANAQKLHIFFLNYI